MKGTTRSSAFEDLHRRPRVLDRTHAHGGQHKEEHEEGKIGAEGILTDFLQEHGLPGDVKYEVIKQHGKVAGLKLYRKIPKPPPKPEGPVHLQHGTADSWEGAAVKPVAGERAWVNSRCGRYRIREYSNRNYYSRTRWNKRQMAQYTKKKDKVTCKLCLNLIESDNKKKNKKKGTKDVQPKLDNDNSNSGSEVQDASNA